MGQKIEIIFGIFLVIAFLLIVMAPLLRRIFAPMIQRWVMGKVEDRVRRMAGMPTRKEEKEAQKRARKRERKGAEGFRRAAGRSREAVRRPRSTVGLLSGLAEDVEFTEIREFSRHIEIGEEKGGKNPKIVVEEQIEDAVYTEIKTRQ